MSDRLTQHLIASHLLPSAVVDEAVRRQEVAGGALDTALLEQGAVSEVEALQAISEVSGIRQVNLADFEPNGAVAGLIPAKIAERLNIAPLSLDGAHLHVACSFPVPREAMDEVGFLLGKKLELWVAVECRVQDWISAIYKKPLPTRFARLITLLDPERGPRGLPEAAKEDTGPKAAPVSSSTPPGPNLGTATEPSFQSVSALPSRLEPSSSVVTPPGPGSVPPQEENWAIPTPAHVLGPPLSFPGGVLPPRELPMPAGGATLERKEPLAIPLEAASGPTALGPPLPEVTGRGPREGVLTQESDERSPAGHESAAQQQAAVQQQVSESESFADLATEPDPSESLKGTSKVQRSDSPTRNPASVLGPASAAPDLRTPSSAPLPPHGEWSLTEARAALAEASHDRERILEVALAFSRRAFEYSAVFAVLKGAAAGWEALGGSGEVQPIRSISIPLDTASVFRTVAISRGSYVGPIPPDAYSRHFIEQLGRAPRAVFLFPVEVKSRLVAMIYGDCGQGTMSHRRLSDYRLFCQDLAGAFQALLVHRKQRGAGATAFTAPASEASTTSSASPAAAFDLTALLRALLGHDPARRFAAMVELGTAPEVSSRALASMFPGPSGWSRLPVAELPEADELGPVPAALSRMGRPGAAALAPLLLSTDPDTRYLAMLTAGSLPFSDLVEGVIRGLFDAEPDITSAARAAATGLRRLPRFIEALKGVRRELQSPEPQRRSLAARALGTLHDRDSVPLLISLTGDPETDCALSAANALREITKANFGAKPRAWAEWWVANGQKRRVEWLVGALRHAEPDLRLAAIEELSNAFQDNLGYFAEAPSLERGAAVRRWESALKLPTRSPSELER